MYTFIYIYIFIVSIDYLGYCLVLSLFVFFSTCFKNPNNIITYNYIIQFISGKALSHSLSLWCPHCSAGANICVRPHFTDQETEAQSSLVRGEEAVLGLHLFGPGPR